MAKACVYSSHQCFSIDALGEFRSITWHWQCIMAVMPVTGMQVYRYIAKRRSIQLLQLNPAKVYMYAQHTFCSNYCNRPVCLINIKNKTQNAHLSSYLRHFNLCRCSDCIYAGPSGAVCNLAIRRAKININT